ASIVGAWAVLIPAKFWEGTKGEAVLRRLTLLILGLGVGAAAYATATLLDIKFSDSPMVHVNTGFQNRFHDAKDGSPLALAYLAYFGALFALVSWWNQANPLRSTRLSVWSIMTCVFWAWVINMVWPFPQPWGMMVAAIVSTSVQLVSPLVPEDERMP